MGEALDWLCRYVGAAFIGLAGLVAFVVVANFALTRAAKSLRLYAAIIEFFYYRRAFRQWRRTHGRDGTDVRLLCAGPRLAALEAALRVIAEKKVPCKNCYGPEDCIGAICDFARAALGAAGPVDKG